MLLELQENVLETGCIDPSFLSLIVTYYVLNNVYSI